MNCPSDSQGNSGSSNCVDETAENLISLKGLKLGRINLLATETT